MRLAENLFVSQQAQKSLGLLLLFLTYCGEFFFGDFAILVLVLAAESLFSLGCIFLGLWGGHPFFLADGAIAVGVHFGEGLGWVHLWLFLLGVAFGCIDKAGQGQNGEDRGDRFHDIGRFVCLVCAWGYWQNPIPCARPETPVSCYSFMIFYDFSSRLVF